MTKYCTYVAVETTLIDSVPHSDDAILSVGEDHTYLSWKFHRDSLSILWVTVKYVRRFWTWMVIMKKVVLAGGDRHREPVETPVPHPKKGGQSLLSRRQVVHQKLACLHRKTNRNIRAGDCHQSAQMVMMMVPVTAQQTTLHRLQRHHWQTRQTLHLPRRKVLSQPKVIPYVKNTWLENTSAGCVLIGVTVPMI